MALTISETTFITTQKSGLATKDVYGGKISKKEPINGGKQSISGSGLPIDILGMTNLSPSATRKRFDKLLADLGNAALQASGNYRKAAENIKNITGNKANLRREFQGALLTDVLTNLGYKDNAAIVAGQIIGEKDYRKILGGIGKLEPDLGVVINGITTILDAKNLDTAKGISDVLTKLTGDDKLVKVLNLTEETTLLKGALIKATELRIPELFDTIIGEVKNDNEKKRLMIQTVPAAISNSDVSTMRKVMDEVTSEAINTTYPDAAKWLIENYKTLDGNMPKRSDEVELINTLHSLDKEWWLIERNGEKVINYSLFTDVSEHAKSIFIRHPVLKYPAIIASNYSGGDAMRLSEKYRPWIKLPA